MSEAEKKRRAEYQLQRKKRIWIQAIAIIVIAVLVLACTVTYFQLNKTYYIGYSESSDLAYKVHLTDNEFYGSDPVESGQTYINELVEKVVATFSYSLNMDDAEAKYDYVYGVVTELEVKHKQSGNVIYSETEEVVPEQSYRKDSGGNLQILESVVLDYVKYDKLATKFISQYKLEGEAVANVKLTFNVRVISHCSTEKGESVSANNTYFKTLNVPVGVTTVSCVETSSAPNGEHHYLECPSAVNANAFKVIGIILAVIDVILAGVLVAFIFLTRNDDINYAIKVRRLRTSYGSYIQEIKNEFDREGYQILYLGAFSEMLEIRDTIQSPILMFENEDKTRTEFFITTNTKILYLYEIKVEDYDEIYANQLAEETEEICEEEAVIEADPVLEEIDYVDEIDEETDDGVEVIGVVWPEKAHKNKIYRYDPNGETVYEGDVVLVPTRDHHSNKEVQRKAAVAHGNHKVDPAMLKHPVKKIIGVIKRRFE